MTLGKRRKIRPDEIVARLRGRVPEEIQWPCDRWRNDILGFARDVLGVEWLSPEQEEVLLAFQDGAWTTIKGGRKSGKTRAAAICAWWYVCTFADARVVMTAPTENSVEQILWRDIKYLHQHARIALGGDIHQGPKTGWRDGLRAIYGRVARDAGGIRGLSGANVAYILDEASDIPDDIWETINGNLAGGVGGLGRASRALLVSNPSRLQGFFYDSHFRDSRFYRIHMPSVPRDDRPGMATSEWIQSMRDAYGEDSTYYIVHILGDFPSIEESRIVSMALLEAALARWADAPDHGDLSIGLDPATSENNDEAAFAIRRGPKIVTPPRCYRGQSYDDLAALTCEILDEFQRPGERPRVVVDSQGPIGDGTMRALKAAIPRERVRLIGLHWDGFRHKFPSLARSYNDINGARWGTFARWLRDGGALPPDQKLRDELTFPVWILGESSKRKIPRKDEFREALGRSPDRADAVINATWLSDPQALPEVTRTWSAYQGDPVPAGHTYDPYDGAWHGGP